MRKQEETRKKDRRDLLLVLLILPLGILCMFFVGGAAIKLTPEETLVADMGSNLDPNIDFAARSNPELIQPIGSGILTKPVWGGGLFLTPSAVIPTRVRPTAISTPQTQPTSQPTTVPTPTNKPTPTAFPTSIGPPPTKPPPGPRPTLSPTSTLSPTPTSSPLPTSTPTFTSTPFPSADLGITKDDGSATYTPGAGISYTIIVTNTGPDNAPGFDITDNVPAAITGLTITCVPVGTASCGTDGTVGNNVSFTNASLDAGVGNQLTITISGTVDVATTGNLSNTVNIVIPVGASFVDPDLSNNSATDTDVELPVCDLSITKTDYADVYLAGSKAKYTITVSNAGPSNVTGATVDDILPGQIDSWDWVCFEVNGAGGCDPVTGSTMNFSDDVDLPAGASITYYVDAYINPASAGDLANNATVTAPAGFTDPNPGNNNAADTDALYSGVDIGPPTGTWENPIDTTFVIDPPIVAGGDGTYDFVYFERENPPGAVQLDWVQIQVSPDGQAWYSVFYWGDSDPGVPDTNTNMDYVNLINDLCATEIDNCNIPAGRMYNNSGITIDIDAIPGVVGGMEYPWIRVTSYGMESTDLDSIQPYYP
jgi:uncharacterized repeat protein (TIGR01451 family)